LDFENIHEQIQIVHRPADGNCYALHALNIAEGDTPATTEFNQGDFWAEGDHVSPSHIWVRLPGNLDPSSQNMRWVDKENAIDYQNGGQFDGTDFVGLANLDVAYGAGAGTQKDGVIVIRGNDWRVEKCSARDGNIAGFEIRGKRHYFYNCIAIRNGRVGFRPAGLDNDTDAGSVDSITFERCYAMYNNSKAFDPSWEAGGWKITDSNHANNSSLGMHFIECYASYNGAEETWPGYGAYSPGIWSDLGGHWMTFDRCFMFGAGKGNWMQELATNNITLNHCVLGLGKENDSGCAGQELGPGIRIQSSNRGNYNRCTIYSNWGKGAYIKHDDSRAADNFHSFDKCLFVNNGLGAGAVSQGDHEVFVGDETHSPFNSSTTNTFTDNIYKPRSGNNPFHKVGNGETSSISTWYTWVGGSGDQVVTGQVLEDENSEFGFMPIAAYAGFGADAQHPLTFDTYWTPQYFAQPTFV